MPEPDDVLDDFLGLVPVEPRARVIAGTMLPEEWVGHAVLEPPTYRLPIFRARRAATAVPAMPSRS